MNRQPILRATLRAGGKRLFSAGLAITISVAFVVTALLLVDSFNRTMEAQAQAQAAGADVVVETQGLWSPDDAEEEAGASRDSSEDSGEGGEPVPGEDYPGALADALAEQPEVETAQAIDRAGVMFDRSGTDGFTMISAMPEYAGIEVAEGELPEEDSDLLIGRDLAEAYGLEVGDAITTEPPGERELTVVGISDGAHTADQALVTDRAMDSFAEYSSPDSIMVVLGEGHGDSQAQQDFVDRATEVVAEMMAQGELPALDQAGEELDREPGPGPEGGTAIGSVAVFTQDEIVDLWIEQLSGGTTMLTMVGLGFGAIALFVSALVIYNTFQVLVVSRTAMMALLRAVGATSAQVIRATLAEGAVLGLIGAVAGVVLGWCFAYGASTLASQMWLPGFATAQPTVAAVLAGAGLGVGVTVISTALPAIRSGRIAPMEALRPADVVPAEASGSRLRVAAGAVLTAGGLAAVLGAALLNLALLGVAGAMIGFAGVLILCRPLVPRLISLLGRFWARVLPGAVPAGIVANNARQTPGRIAATTSALLIGVTLVATMTVGATTAQKFMADELTDRYPVDGAIVAPSSSDIADALEADDVVTDTAEFSGDLLTAGEPEDAGNELVGVSSSDLLASGITRGDAVEVEDMLQLGVALTGTGGHGGSDQEASEAYDLTPTGESGEITLIRISDDATGADLSRLRSAVDPFASEVFLEPAEMRASVGEVVDTVLIVVLVLLAASVIVAVLGVSNTLALSVAERRREAALLRALGMTRSGVGSMISLEAVLMAAVALVLGSALGVYFGWAGVASLVGREDMSVALSVPWLRMGLIWAAAFAAALLAAAIPARAFSRTQPAAGLSQG